MGTAVVITRAATGVSAPRVRVEIHTAGGLPSMNIVGLAETAVRESRDRVRSAVANSHFQFPSGRITVNLAPADLPKEGARFDLAIAIGLLAATGQVPVEPLAQTEFLGELGLTGALRPVRAVLPAVLAARDAGHAVILPAHNAPEAGLINGADCHGAEDLAGVAAHLLGEARLPLVAPNDRPATAPPQADIAEVRGQHTAKRALLLCAAGGHNLLMIGPPGTGKTMLAQRLPGLLPPMGEREAIESASIASVASGRFDAACWLQRPFRAPHHSASAIALIGGGSHPRPGEVSLAHNGVLFLDELPEFDRRALESLREPLESGMVTISRAARQASFPARVRLVASMNPCPCGYLGDADRCHCSPDQVRRYRSRVSGPLLDRIDLHVEGPRLATEELLAEPMPPEASTAALREQVLAAVARQLDRGAELNDTLEPAAFSRICRLDADCQALLRHAAQRLGLSARASHRAIRVARTIADLAGSDAIRVEHLGEALTYRRLDRGATAA